ncbi:6862_t:CDS:2, partial [Cetraspora pellucida]
PSLSSCDSSDCLITNDITEETDGYYHNSIDMHVQLLLNSLSQLNLGNIEKEDSNSTSNDNDVKESADGISDP